MLRPSTAPRWKIAMSSRRRPVAASAVRARNDGAKPSDSIVIAPDFRKMRREVMASLPSTTLEFRATDLRGALRRQLLRDVHARDQRAGRHPRFRGVVIAGWRLALIGPHAELLQRLQQLTWLAHLTARRADTADDELERRLDLHAPVFRGVELR